MLTDSRIFSWIEGSNRELLEPGQEVRQIKNTAAKASRFMMTNMWIFEDLIQTLKDEQMMDAVGQIGQEILDLGKRVESDRLQAFAQLILGELASIEPYIKDEERARGGIQ